MSTEIAAPLFARGKKVLVFADLKSIIHWKSSLLNSHFESVNEQGMKRSIEDQTNHERAHGYPHYVLTLEILDLKSDYTHQLKDIIFEQ